MNTSSNACPFGPNVETYWKARYSLFSRWDEGIQTDEQGLYSVKPEAAAREIATLINGSTVLDAFAGIGGSAIAFAAAGKKVKSVDLAPSRLAQAKHNAQIYGVHDQIEFVEQDALNAIEGGTFDAIYLDPPWGGTLYLDRALFKFENFSPDGRLLIQLALRHAKQVLITLPINFDWNELRALEVNLGLHWSHAPANTSFAEGRLLFVTAFISS